MRQQPKERGAQTRGEQWTPGKRGEKQEGRNQWRNEKCSKKPTAKKKHERETKGEGINGGSKAMAGAPHQRGARPPPDGMRPAMEQGEGRGHGCTGKEAGYIGFLRAGVMAKLKHE